ncbi:hypothetical protein [Halioxenophilus sp. WMMB6]|uniref:ApeP family dehydratase n=1 Tax=Halioxenophilus sp. WMMB6 TaxID=3073815 RepID=UPI00295E8B81|nr:hypothetical protein [Halioxenophilus sp. WMMB6]
MTVQRPYGLPTEAKAQLEVLLTHRDPMILLDEVLALDEVHAVSRVVVQTTSRFFRDDLGGVPSWVGLEYMAQTIALWGSDQLLLQGKPVAIGFLLGSRCYDTSARLFTPGMRLLTEIKPSYLEESGLSSFDCTIRLEQPDGAGQVLATAAVNAFRPERHEEFVAASLRNANHQSTEQDQGE